MPKVVQSDLKVRAEDLDARHPGSTFVQELVSYGKYFDLVSSPFAYLSSDFKPLVDCGFHSTGKQGTCFDISNLM